MRVLVVGGGGREHALAWKLAHSPSVTELHAAPGNAGIGEVAARHSVAADDLDGQLALAGEIDADLVVVGPEAPLVAGLADRLAEHGRVVLGPSAAAARLEGSKAFAKELMARHGIPTARAGTFDDRDKAVAFVDELGGDAVVKADGLAAGKGVTVAASRGEAVAAIDDALVHGAFGAAGRTVVVEERLDGPEVSAFALVSGQDVVPLGLAQDFKRIGDGDTGPNTGGMGAYSPLVWLDAETERVIWDDVVRATAHAMTVEGVSYRGVLFAGLLLTDDGPKVLEFNCRFGDPETQVLMPRLDADLGELLAACAHGDLRSAPSPAWRPGSAVTVVLASGGYPGPYETGLEISGLERAGQLEGVTIFHAGTERAGDSVTTSGGRVLAVSALGSSLAEARRRAYEACEQVSFQGMQYRRDIAARAAEADAGGAAGRERRGGWMSDQQEEREPLVGVLAASPSELPIMRQAGLILEKFGIAHEVRIMSAHRNPDDVDLYARTAFDRGLKVIVCSTGLSGHLAAAMAARTVLPVIGVPIASSPRMVGNEALAITAQMPTGVPIATVGVDASVNAAVLAAQIVGTGDPNVQATLWKFKDDLAEGLKL